MSYDLVIANATVVGPGGVGVADVAIRGETIAAVGRGWPTGPGRSSTRSGKYLIPGGVDVHVHLELPFCGTTSSDDWETGTRAAARGGVTTVIDFAIPYGEEIAPRRLRELVGPGRAQGVPSTTASTWPSPTGTATAPRWPRWSRWAARRSRSS